MTAANTLFQPEKYLRTLKSEGLTAAITSLHHDMEQWDQFTFEGREGYQPEIWQEIARARQFSRELWDRAADLDFNSRKSGSS